MRVLLTGATGLIGGAIARALLAAGHELVCAVRTPSRLDLVGPRCRVIACDFASVPDAVWWAPHLAGIDAVVNAVGILREQDGQRFDALHRRAPAELFRAAAAAGVGCVVQISALGADGGRTGYQRSKHAADEVLRGLGLPGAIVQPSLVFAPHGASSRLFLTLASTPLLALPQRGRMPVSPVHLDDVAGCVLAVLQAPPQPVRTIACAGPQTLGLRDYLGSLRRQLGLGCGPLVLPLPSVLFRAGAAVAGRLPGSALDADTATMLLQGNAAAPDELTAVLGRPPRPVGGFLPGPQVPGLRAAAVLGWALPASRAALAALWLWTAVVSAGLYPVQGSLDLLARVGLHGGAAWLALYAACALDAILGLLTLWSPPRWRSWVWAAQCALVAGYTVLITLFLPEQWLHPYGPISKNLPIMALIALLWALEPRQPR